MARRQGGPEADQDQANARHGEYHFVAPRVHQRPEDRGADGDPPEESEGEE
jgi:hypothetical protein